VLLSPAFHINFSFNLLRILSPNTHLIKKLAGKINFLPSLTDQHIDLFFVLTNKKLNYLFMAEWEDFLNQK
jgi:hypothetical protein